MGIKDLLQLTISRNASDLHIIKGIPPHLRVEGQLSPVPNEPALTPEKRVTTLSRFFLFTLPKLVLY